jgi:hypothetical protein
MPLTYFSTPPLSVLDGFTAGHYLLKHVSGLQ